MHDPNAKMDYLSDSDILYKNCYFSYVWDRVKVRTFFRNISHILFFEHVYNLSHALQSVSSLLRRGIEAQDSPPKPSCDSPGVFSRSWPMFYNLVPLHCVPKSVPDECGGYWGCSPNPTDLAVISSLRQNVLLGLVFFHRPWLGSSWGED